MTEPKAEKPGIPFTFRRKNFRGIQLPASEEEFKPEVEAFLNSLNREWRCRYRSFKLTGILLMPFPDTPSYAWDIPPSHWVYICEDDKQIGHCEPERFESEYLRSDGLDVEQLQSQIESGVADMLASTIGSRIDSLAREIAADLCQIHYTQWRFRTVDSLADQIKPFLERAAKQTAEDDWEDDDPRSMGWVGCDGLP